MIAQDNIILSDTNPSLGENVTVTVVVENVGQADASQIEVALLQDGAQVGTALIPFISHSTSSDTVVFEVTATHEGLQILTAIADPKGLIPEQSELENLATRALLVGEGFPGLVLVDAAVVPGIVFTGGTANLVGAARYNPAYSVGGPLSGGFVEVFYQGIDPGLSPDLDLLREKVFTGRTLSDGSFRMGIESPLDSGTFTLAVLVSDRTVQGFRSTDFASQAPTGPDLLVQLGQASDNFGIQRGDQALDIFFDTQPIENGETVILNAKIYNVGLADALNVEYRLSLDTVVLRFDTIPIVRGKSNFAAITFPIRFTSGGATFHDVSIFADPNNLIPDEFREGNNFGVRTFRIWLDAFDRLPNRRR